MRHYIGVAPRGITVLRNIRNDDTGEPLLYLDEGAVDTVQINFAEFLNTGETISSATATAEGCTASASTSSPNVTLTVSNASDDGKITVTATTSASNVFPFIMRVRKPLRYGDEATLISDYV
jgi:hypothetical protein